MTMTEQMAFQGLDVYRLAKDFAVLVCEAGIADKELRDQATRAAKSTFLNLCEGLPNDGKAMRRKYFVNADNSLHEAVGAMDLAAVLKSVAKDKATEAQSMGLRLHKMLRALSR
jgi:four helix bundle protein